MDGFSFLTIKSREWPCLHWSVARGSIIFVWLGLMTTGQGALLHKCLLPGGAPDPPKQAVVDLSVRQPSSSHHHPSSPLWGPSCPSAVTACCPPRPPLPPFYPPTPPPSPPNLVACRANLAQLPMIILSAVVSPAEEETGRAGVLPRGNNEQRPISHKLAEEVLASRAATSQALGWCCQAHLLPPKPSAAPPCTARTFKGKAPTSLPSTAWGYSRLGLILDNH